MAFCRQCGTEIPNEAAFCNNCGAPVNAVPPLIYVKPKVPGRGFGISSMVLGIIGLVYSFAFAFSMPTVVNELAWDSASAGPESLLPSVIMLAVMPVLILCFSPIAIKRGYKNGISISGLIMGAIALIGYAYAAFVIIGNV